MWGDLGQDDIEGIVNAASRKRPFARGGNSVLTEVVVGDEILVVKDYSRRSDGKRRQRQETRAMNFLTDKLPGRTPKVIGVSRSEVLAVHSWVPGHRPVLNDVTVRAMVDFQAELLILHKRFGSEFPWSATDAAGTVDEILLQCAARCEELSRKGLALHDVVGQVAEILEEANLSPPVSLGHPKWTLSPSDYGPHNMLLDGRDRSFLFLDFEFFGHDDAHKLVADTVLHPQTRWTGDLMWRYIQESMVLFGLNSIRLREYFRALSVKWVLIALKRISDCRMEPREQAMQSKLIKVDAYLQLARQPRSNLDELVDAIAVARQAWNA